MAADPAVGRAGAGLRTKASPEAQAAQLLFERHGDRVLAYCRRRLSSPEEAEDALQTTFLYACRGLQRGVVPETEIAWLLKIAHNVCLSHWDSDRRRRRLELVRDPERLEASTPTAAGSRDDLHALEAALAGLTDLQRRAIVLREWRGLSYAEIAAELDLSQAAVETLIFRARRALATSLEEQDVGTRKRLVRGLDLGGLLAGLKSLLGAGVPRSSPPPGSRSAQPCSPARFPMCRNTPRPSRRRLRARWARRPRWIPRPRRARGLPPRPRR